MTLNLTFRTHVNSMKCSSLKRQSPSCYILRKPTSNITYDNNGTLLCVSLIDWASKWFLLAVLHSKILCLCQYPLAVGHPGEGHMHDEMRRNFYWLHLDSNFYTTFNVFVCVPETARPTTNKVSITRFYFSSHWRMWFWINLVRC